MEFKKFFLPLALFIYIIFIYSVFACSIEESSIVFREYETKSFINSVLPQGWGFFTKTPREDNVDIYKINDFELKKLSIPNASYKNWFGFSKKSRRIGMEISIILNQIPDSLWREDSNMSDIKIPKSNFILPSNRNLGVLKHGDYVLIKYRIPPWAWAKKISKNQLKYKTIKVICGNTVSLKD